MVKDQSGCNTILVVEDDEDIRNAIIDLLESEGYKTESAINGKDAKLAPLPIMVVSAVADKKNTQGSVGFLKKPIDIDTLLKVVAQYCDELSSTSPLRSSEISKGGDLSSQ